MAGPFKPDYSETFERYALGLAREEGLPDSNSAKDREARRQKLIAELLRRGARGWPERRTFYTRSLPAGCVPCLQGQGSNLALTTRCNRDCFFCFNPKPRSDVMSVHGRKVASLDEVPVILEEFGARSVGLSGGEPLLNPERVLDVIGRLRRRFGPSLRIDLYTNGDLLTIPLLYRLKKAGLDALRINLAASRYDIGRVKLALSVFTDVEIEIPTIPEHKDRLKSLIEELDRAGVPHLVLHELFSCAQNLDSLRDQGFESKGNAGPKGLMWEPVASSEETALELMLHALEVTRNLSVYYCSCGTQEWIAERALRRQEDARRDGKSARPAAATRTETERL